MYPHVLYPHTPPHTQTDHTLHLNAVRLETRCSCWTSPLRSVLVPLRTALQPCPFLWRGWWLCKLECYIVSLCFSPVKTKARPIIFYHKSLVTHMRVIVIETLLSKFLARAAASSSTPEGQEGSFGPFFCWLGCLRRETAGSSTQPPQRLPDILRAGRCNDSHKEGKQRLPDIIRVVTLKQRCSESRHGRSCHFWQ